MSTLRSQRQRFTLDRQIIVWGMVIIGIELFTILVYVFLQDQVTITNPLVLVYPFIWINVGLWVITTTSPVTHNTRLRRGAILLAGTYFVILAGAGGLVGLGTTFFGEPHAGGFRIVTGSIPPGWGPALLYSGPLVIINLFPFKAIGYLALSYLVYATIIDTAGSALAGFVGIFSCVSCTWPVLGTILTGVVGATSGVTAVVMTEPYFASTAVYLSAVALLYWRPFN